MCEPHLWRDTGKQDLHVDFMHIVDGQHRTSRCFAIYVRCDTCKQPGFRKPGSRVVYTWTPDVV